MFKQPATDTEIDWLHIGQGLVILKQDLFWSLELQVFFLALSTR